MIIGIDPGISKHSLGAIAYICEGNEKEPTTKKYNVIDLLVRDSPKGVRRLGKIWIDFMLFKLNKYCGVSLIVLEEVPVIPGKSSYSSYFKMGHTQATIEFAADHNNIPLVFVNPRTWKSHYNLIKKGKKGSLKVARELFPDMSDKLTRIKDHNRAEALLIAKYGLSKNFKYKNQI